MKIATVPDDDCMISAKDVCRMLGNCSRMHLWRLVCDPAYVSLNFPKPISIGKVGRNERKFFRIGDVKAWLARRAACCAEAAD